MEFPRALVAVSHVIKDKSSGVENASTLENSVLKKHRFQIAPPWRAFSNGSVFGDRLPRCSVDNNRIRSKTALFSFENGFSVDGT